MMSAVDPKTLPIRDYAEKILEAVRSNPVTIVIGETGSGKTTQISQVCNLDNVLATFVLWHCNLHKRFDETYQSCTMGADSGRSWLCQAWKNSSHTAPQSGMHNMFGKCTSSQTTSVLLYHQSESRELQQTCIVSRPSAFSRTANMDCCRNHNLHTAQHQRHS